MPRSTRQRRRSLQLRGVELSSTVRVRWGIRTLRSPVANTSGCSVYRDAALEPDSDLRVLHADGYATPPRPADVDRHADAEDHTNGYAVANRDTVTNREAGVCDADLAIELRRDFLTLHLRRGRERLSGMRVLQCRRSRRVLRLQRDSLMPSPCVWGRFRWLPQFGWAHNRTMPIARDLQSRVGALRAPSGLIRRSRAKRWPSRTPRSPDAGFSALLGG